jgi:transcription-repair coupling factor (superfamily II helicase)
MNQAEFLQLFKKYSQVDQVANALQEAEIRIHLKGLVGSSRAAIASAVASQVPGNHLFVLSDKEEAAYFLNDLENLFPNEKHIVFYPASYRSAYHFEETDNANVVLRAEVLEKINNGTNTWIVTYPQALFEKIPTQKKLTENTLKVQKGKSYSLDFMNELLLEYGFERLDFVYEPGQFAIRGGILDALNFLAMKWIQFVLSIQ